jgi:hypothetical protein
MKARSDKALRYKLILRDTSGWDAVAWCYSFDLPANKVRDENLRAPRTFMSMYVNMCTCVLFI